MEITQTVTDGILDVAVEGRLDGYWSDHLERTVAEAISNGHHRIRLDCAKLTFLSSAGLGVLVKFHQRLKKIHGTFQIVNPSKPVSSVLTMTNLSVLLQEPQRPTEAAVTAERGVRRLEQSGASFEIYDLDPGGSLAYRAIGSAAPLSTGAFPGDCLSLEPASPTFAVGVGAFGDSAADCRTRAGELLAVANATAYQPADGTNVPDYLVGTGAMASDLRVLYGFTCTGQFSHLVRFEATAQGSTIGLSKLLDACLGASGTPAIGVVVIAEAAGLVGASLRRAPVERFESGDFFTHPAVRSRLAFTAEPAFVRGVALAAGVATRAAAGAPEPADPERQLRPIGDACRGHLHAAAFAFRPVRKGRIDFKETVAGLFEAEALLGVLHLLHDDRGSAGAGESEFVRGACWIAPLAGEVPA